MNRATPFPGASFVLEEEAYAFADFPIPGRSGRIEVALLNRDPALGPVTAVMRMGPGARIPAHYHARTTESLLVLDGRFLNAGVAYGPGAYLAIRIGDVHGPHETQEGCTLLFMQMQEVDPADFHVAE